MRDVAPVLAESAGTSRHVQVGRVLLYAGRSRLPDLGFEVHGALRWRFLELGAGRLYAGVCW